MEALIVPIFALLMQLIYTSPVVDKITLLPDAEGKAGAVVVTTKQGEYTLNEAYGTLAVRQDNSLNPKPSSAADIQQKYGELLALQPKPAMSFTLFFTSGSDSLTSESANTITTIKSEITNYPATEISVIGHTDSVGKAEDNDALSVKRAMAARAILIENGITPEIIEAQGRGERELLINTGDEVAEPKNRRVEVNMR